MSAQVVAGEGSNNGEKLVNNKIDKEKRPIREEDVGSPAGVVVTQTSSRKIEKSNSNSSTKGGISDYTRVTVRIRKCSPLCQ